MSRSADIGTVRSDTGFNEWEALKAVTQDTRANLITDIVGHPKGMPSMKELEYMNPSVSRSTISGHLDTLIDVGVVDTVEFPPGERPARDLPYTFYYLTDDARELFDRNNLFDEGIWRDTYAQVRTTDEIDAAEAVTRPHIG